MFETWLRESKVRLLAPVMLEAWLRLSNFFLISSANLYRIMTQLTCIELLHFLLQE